MKTKAQELCSYVDMHVHSYYSDGTMSPEAILKRAAQNGVRYLAIADHNTLKGTAELLKIADDYGICACSGVELDTLENGKDVHILGYGMSLENRDFHHFVNENRAHLDAISDRLIEKMVRQHHQTAVSTTGYRDFCYDRSRGGWKALHYFMAVGLTSSLYEGMRLYETYNCGYDQAPFSDIQSVCEKIHAAGGIAVLAHPGVTVSEAEVPAFLEYVSTRGIDGIECHYPKHSEALTKACVTFCRSEGLYITTGSDCHGTFGNTDIGEMQIAFDALDLQHFFKDCHKRAV
ncbi:PHP domain-containing protein [Fusibacter paucivorans]|uniref:PHP domain-containing protein n=1 Tax=Fusibacter paucivorans TaxID=76009 RepID=A0ABS5PPF0_9FIRM|nr:PHP domain-containing protein [Fusibacter paucivorans]MBS7525917.1 PHP domain-containing protein [Fusibacter paucivorans]